MKKSKKSTPKKRINPNQPIPFVITARGKWALALATLNLGGVS